MAAKKAPALKPASTLVKKNSLVVPIVLCAVIVIAAIVIFFMTHGNINKSPILATVNGEPIYQDDIDMQFSQLPPEYQAQYSKEFILNQTIDKRLILQDGERRGISVTSEEVDAQVKSIIEQFGLNETDLENILSQKNITVADYKESVLEEMLLNKIIQDAVSSRVQVSEEELVNYYDDHPDEFTAPAGGVIVSHILVENESTANEVIGRLDKGESFEQLAESYSIDEGSRMQGGYIGIVTTESAFVTSFKTASLALKLQHYTKNPVQSEYGYHVIKRLADVESYSQVRLRIEKQLKIQKQIVLFQSFLSDIRAKATIKFYTEQGVVTRQPAAGSLGTFSQCVAAKTTLYGTKWSDFSQEQQKLFGDSFGYLTYVDCDDKPHICSAANIQKYPTWVIGSEQFGKLSLQELSDKTGCELPN